MQSEEYNKGFLAGIKFMLNHFKEAARRVEKPLYGEVEKDGKKYTVITRSGQPIFASRLRELCHELEAEINANT
jgi:hypothetical protein